MRKEDLVATLDCVHFHLIASARFFSITESARDCIALDPADARTLASAQKFENAHHALNGYRDRVADGCGADSRAGRRFHTVSGQKPSCHRRIAEPKLNAE